MGVMAAAQGTMNNLSFGDSSRQYYETIAGGTGAGEGFAGADGIKPHDQLPAHRSGGARRALPVRLERFALRPNSGGAGQWPGGRGLERRLRFLEPMTVSLLERLAPDCPLWLGGRGRMLRDSIAAGSDGSVEELGGCAQWSWPLARRWRCSLPAVGATDRRFEISAGRPNARRCAVR